MLYILYDCLSIFFLCVVSIFIHFLDLEALMNSFISLILFCNFDEKLTRKFCTKLTEVGASQSNALLRIKMYGENFLCLNIDWVNLKLAYFDSANET